MGIKIVSVAEMRAIEEAADKAGHSFAAMMELAGRGLAEQIPYSGANILVLVGPGNNGGDGLVAAKYLSSEVGANVTVYQLETRKKTDPLIKSAQEAGVVLVDYPSDAKNGFQGLHDLIVDTDFIVDALFGIGARLPIEGNAAKLLTQVHAILQNAGERPTIINPAAGAPPNQTPIIIACDCPSGLNCDTGELDPLALHADVTVTFAAAKPGLFLFPGAEAVGELVIADIGLAQDMPELVNVGIDLADGVMVKNSLPTRKRDSHKGTFGKALVVAGSLNYIGAAYLAGKAAYRAGAGLVTIGAPQPIIPTLAAMLPEATWVLLPHEMGVLHENAVPILREEIEKYDALLMGPGFSNEDSTKRFIELVLQSGKPHPATQKHIGFHFNVPEESQPVETKDQVKLPPLVIDADGLNLLAEITDWSKLLPPNTILTPHPGEFARLAGLKDEENGPSAIQQVQTNRLGLAAKYAQEWKAVVVLKGAFTVVAEPNGHVTLLPFATSALATAGTGDVLAGVIVSLLAQGLEPAKAAIAGAWLHGYAGEEISDDSQLTPASVMASDVLEALPKALAAVTR
ncbi:MAG: NAD(P)H-hydrate epimerase [Chloroflexi bacterium]|nr:NAD(P)H-hydrate epimerase [Chloroflexota bacterium]